MATNNEEELNLSGLDDVDGADIEQLDIELTPAAAGENPKLTGVLSKLNLLSQNLRADNPNLKNYLVDIHKELIQHGELVHLLKREDWNTLMRAQQLKTGITLATTAKESVKKATAVAARSKTANDFI